MSRSNYCIVKDAILCCPHRRAILWSSFLLCCLSSASCSAGRFYNSSLGSCQSCPRDTYQPSGGQSACLACPTNKITLDVGTSSLDSCLGNTETSIAIILSGNMVVYKFPLGFHFYDYNLLEMYCLIERLLFYRSAQWFVRPISVFYQH